MMIVFAKYFRGFKWIDVDLNKVTFLVGDNSSGKTSILHLVNAVCSDDLDQVPYFEEKFGVGSYDYFSPFFEYSDVHFGYGTTSNGVSSAKIITVTRGQQGIPTVTRCTYFLDGKCLSFMREGSVLKYSSSTYEFNCFQQMMDFHCSVENWNESKHSFSLSVNSPSVFMMHVHDDPILSKESIGTYFNLTLKSSRLVSGIRSLPEKFYSSTEMSANKSKNFASMWFEFTSDYKRSKYLERVNRFGKESGLFDSISVLRVSEDIPESPFIIKIEKGGREFFLNQVGVGVSQIVPVLIEVMYSIDSGEVVTLIQQPELHLHPVAQAAMGSYLFDSCSLGMRTIIETHSSYLIDRFRADIRDSNKKEDIASIPNSSLDVGDNQDSKLIDNDNRLNHSDIVIMFCEATSEGNRATEILISETGELLDEPDEFHEFFVSELLRTMF